MFANLAPTLPRSPQVAADGVERPARSLPTSAASQRLAPQADARPTVLHFIYGIGGGGAESMLRGLVRHLDRQRWRVVVVAMRAAGRPAEAAELLQSCDAFHALEETSFLSRSALRKLWRVLRQERPAVVQTWMHHADFVGGLVARLAGVPQVVWSIHCREITRAPGESAWKTALLRRLIPLAARVAPRCIVSCSQVALEDHARIGYPRAKMLWISNGIDTQRFRPSETARAETRQRLGLTENAPVLGFVGRFHEMKNLPLLLRAFALLTARLPAARLVLCGVREEDLDTECRSLAAALPEPERVVWLPFQSEPELFYPALDLFTLSSRTEACPMTVLEAMACGVPCVTTDVGDCALLTQDTGAATPPGDAAALCAAWEERLRLAPEARAAAGTAARQRVMEHFTLEQAAESYMRLYESLIPVAAE